MSLLSLTGRLGRRGVRLIDLVLVRVHAIETFADDPECILRASFRRLNAPLRMPDGARLESGDILIEIHFWNEHLPRIGEGGADLLWGRQFGRRLTHSLGLLAARVACDPRYADFVAVHGILGFIPEALVDPRNSLVRRFGFMLALRDAPGLRFWTGAFWEGLYSWWLMWTFNPNTLRGKRLREMALSDLWMSREVLLRRYGMGTS
jgi:hypothetical protein